MWDRLFSCHFLHAFFRFYLCIDRFLFGTQYGQRSDKFMKLLSFIHTQVHMMMMMVWKAMLIYLFSYFVFFPSNGFLSTISQQIIIWIDTFSRHWRHVFLMVVVAMFSFYCFSPRTSRVLNFNTQKWKYKRLESMEYTGSHPKTIIVKNHNFMVSCFNRLSKKSFVLCIFFFIYTEVCVPNKFGRL